MAKGPIVEMLARNVKFAAGYQAPPGLQEMASGIRGTGKGVVVLSCSDPRLNPYQILGIDPTLKATMVRNAGGRVFDAIRTLSVLQTIGAPGTIAIMHHTDCGMTHFHDDVVQQALIEIAPEEKATIEGMKFGEIKNSIEDSVREDMAMLRASPLITKSTQIVGLAYDIKTGVLTEVTDWPAEKSGL
ncbi:carbonic anhydrase [Amylocarpus encephaloides]|uniref:Carbonic anhydrase n=1 Tax=Amylocarpus encephaloides TaxID=45428 RepID=A0A9P7YSP7_9HELO|nr:carbonic anhydrase [Amylocarpus encephaloides]